LTTNLTASRALIANSNGKVAVSSVTSTELGYLSGVTSAIQTQLNDMWKKIYPVGSIYTSISSTSPATLFGGTWSQIGDGYYLRASSSGAGNTLSEQLPNIKGQATLELTNASAQNGALKITKNSGNREPNWTGDNSWGYLTFDASKSNSVYKDNGVVQPKSYKVYMWRRTA
jgi:hypothetical protein